MSKKLNIKKKQLEPVENIQWIDCDKLKANHYNPNRVMNAEMNLIEKSILRTGWIQPILVNTNFYIIDGFHRWTLSRLSSQLKEKYHGKVPCAVLDVTDAEAMVITVRINRAKGTHLAFRMSEYVKELVQKHNMTLEHLAGEIGATIDEVQLLMRADMFEHKDVENWAYSEAWFPAESGRTRLPTLWDFADGGSEQIKNKERQTLMGEKFGLLETDDEDDEAML